MSMLLSDLPTDALEKIFEAVPIKFPLKYTCRATFQAHRAKTKTPPSFALESVERFEWARSAGYPVTRETVALAARLGKDDIVYWLIKILCVEWSASELSTEACAGGSIAVLEFLEHLALEDQGIHDELEPLPDESSRQMCVAAANGHVHVMRWLRERGHFSGWTVGTAAARGGHIHVLEELQSNCDLNVKDSTFLARAAGYGHTDCAVWLANEGAPLTDTAMLAAAEEGHITTMKMLHRIGVPFHPRTARMVVLRDYLECAKFCAAEMHPSRAWCSPSSMMHMACDSDAVKIVRWLLDSGRVAKVENEHLHAAVRRGREKVLKLLLERGHVPTDDPDLCNVAAKEGALDTLKLLRNHGCAWNEGASGIVCVALRQFHDDVFKYLMENGACPWDQAVCNQAMAIGNLSCLSWLLRSDRVGYNWEELRLYGLNANIRITSYVTRGDHHVYDGWPPPWEEDHIPSSPSDN